MIFLLASFCGDLFSTVTRPWRQLFWLGMHLYISVWSIVLNRISEAFSKCIEVVTAYHREKELEMRLNSVKRDYEDVKLLNNELQRKLDTFTRDRRRIMETLDLVTVDKKKAVETVKVLKNKVQELESVNQQLAENEEVLRRGLAEAVTRLTAVSKLHSEGRCLEHNSLAAKDLASKAFHDTLINGTHLESNGDMQSLRIHVPSSRQVGPKDLEVLVVVESEHGVAFSSSLFSALLSTLVAMIAWEAKDPCTPLVIALFSVVVMSLVNVVRFFTKLQSHQGFLPVALLSLNWFVLGTLAHPALPHVGQMGSSVLWVVIGRFLRLFGFGNIIRAVKVVSHEAFEL